jgi:hypothetical protein
LDEAGKTKFILQAWDFFILLFFLSLPVGLLFFALDSFFHCALLEALVNAKQGELLTFMIILLIIQLFAARGIFLFL